MFPLTIAATPTIGMDSAPAVLLFPALMPSLPPHPLLSKPSHLFHTYPPPFAMRLSPRLFIYVITALACAWFIHRSASLRQASGQAAPAPAPPAAPPVRLAPVVKDASLGNPAARRLPLLVILSADESTLPTDDLRARLQEFCNVIHVETNDDTQRHFKADRIPVAILFNTASEEIGRLHHPWTTAELENLARSASAETAPPPQEPPAATLPRPPEPTIP